MITSKIPLLFLAIAGKLLASIQTGNSPQNQLPLSGGTSSSSSSNFGSSLTSSAANYLNMLRSGISAGTNVVLSGVNLVGDYRTNRSSRMEQVQATEKNWFEAFPLQGLIEFECPKEAFPEPAEWKAEYIHVIAAQMVNASDFQEAKQGLEGIKVNGHAATYVFYHQAADFDLFVLRPAIYPTEEPTPEKAVKFHEFVATLLSSVCNKIKQLKPGRQLVFAGAGNGGAMALILAWRFYLYNEQIYHCGKGSNALNQLAVVTFDTWPIITSERMRTCPLGVHNILNFKSALSVEQHSPRGFETGGYVIDVNSKPSFEHTAFYEERLVSDYIKYPESWSEQNYQEALKTARIAIGQHHAITKHYSSNAVPAFQMGAREIVVRDHKWCANELSKKLIDPLGVSLRTGSGEILVTCRVVKENDDRLRSLVRSIVCSLMSKGQAASVDFAKFTLEIVKTSEPEVPKLSTSSSSATGKQSSNSSSSSNSVTATAGKKSRRDGQWKQCLADMFRISADIGSFNPEEPKRVWSFDFTPAKEPSLCYFRNETTVDLLKIAYTSNRELFYTIFSKVIHRPKPRSCEKVLLPPTIPEKDKGNSDYWLQMMRSFWGELITTTSHDNGQENNNLEATNNYIINILSWPSDYSFPNAFQSLMADVNVCLANHSTKDLVDCTRKDSQFAGVNPESKKNQCPLACLKEPLTTAGCERILPCGNGFFVAMRGSGVVSGLYSPSKDAYSRATPCESKNGRTFHLSIEDKKASLLNMNQMYSTLLVDPHLVPKLIQRSKSSVTPNITNTIKTAPIVKVEVEVDTDEESEEETESDEGDDDEKIDGTVFRMDRSSSSVDSEKSDAADSNSKSTGDNADADHQVGGGEKPTKQIDEAKDGSNKIEENNEAIKADEAKDETNKVDEKKDVISNANEAKDETNRIEEKKNETNRIEEKKDETNRIEEKKDEVIKVDEAKKDENSMIEEKKDEVKAVESNELKVNQDESKAKESPNIEKEKSNEEKDDSGSSGESAPADNSNTSTTVATSQSKRSRRKKAKKNLQ